MVAKVEWHPGELVPHVGFIVTNLSRPAERVVAFYNQRGKAEQYIKEGKNAIKWTRLSCRKFRDNKVRLQLHALAYNLANFMRTLALPKEVEHWSLTTLRSCPRTWCSWSAGWSSALSGRIGLRDQPLTGENTDDRRHDEPAHVRGEDPGRWSDPLKVVQIC